MRNDILIYIYLHIYIYPKKKYIYIYIGDIDIFIYIYTFIDFCYTFAIYTHKSNLIDEGTPKDSGHKSNRTTDTNPNTNDIHHTTDIQ